MHAKLGLIYFQQGKFAQAVPALQQALKLKPTLPNIDILLAMSLSELERFKEALPGLEMGFRKSPDKVLKRMVGLQLLRAYSGLRQHDKAAEIALQLTRAYPTDPEILYHAARQFGNRRTYPHRNFRREGLTRFGLIRPSLRPRKVREPTTFLSSSTSARWRLT